MYNILYRPVWTCGRYDKKSHTALLFNNISGLVYSYVDYAADVIGLVLESQRGAEVSIRNVALKSGIAEESIEEFFEDLINNGLLVEQCPSSALTDSYRRAASEYRKKQAQTVIQTTQEKLPFEMSTAEMEYMERVGGVTSVMFELTYRCSEKCIHCYNIGATRNDEEKSHRGNRDELTFEDYKRIIDDLYENGLTKVCLTGGDPFSNKYVWDILAYLYAKEIAIIVFTNGQSIVRDVEKLANYFPLTVGVSIYSGNPQEHDYITRINGSWEKSISVVKDLCTLGVPTNLKCCVMRPNLKHYHEVADLAKQYGSVPQFEISVSDSIEGDTCVSKYLRLRPEELEIVLRDDNVPLYVGKQAPNFGGQKKRMDVSPCGAGRNTFCVTPEGELIPCCSFHMRLGDLKHSSFSEIASEGTLNYWGNKVLSDYEECGTHDYCDYCNLCPGHNYSQHGDFRKASENCCYIAHVRHDLAKKMMQGYDPLGGKTLAMRLAELPDYVPQRLKREITEK